MRAVDDYQLREFLSRAAGHPDEAIVHRLAACVVENNRALSELHINVNVISRVSFCLTRFIGLSTLTRGRYRIKH